MIRRLRLLASVALVLATIPVAVAGTPTPAGASHFRANQINWHTAGTPGEVEFHFSGSWRLSYYYYESSPGSNDSHPIPEVGDVFTPASVDLDDGSYFDGYWTVTAVDEINDVVSAEAHYAHQYGGSGPWTVAIDECCRLSDPLHRNNPDENSRVAAFVNPSGTTSSPVSQIPPIVDCPIESSCDFFIPATDSDQQTLSFRMATPTEAGGYDHFNQPAGASVDPSTGLYSWNTTGAPLNDSCLGGSQIQASCDSFFSTQVVIENHSNGTLVATTPVDFFIRVTDSVNLPPAFDAPTPADGAVIEAPPGQPISIPVAASDPDETDLVTLGMIGRPGDSSFTFTAGNPATGTFSWSAPTPGDHLLTFLAQDRAGRGALPRSITLSITDLPAFVSPTPSDGAVVSFFTADTGRFTVKAVDPQANDIVTLGSMGIPPGGTYQYVGVPGNPSEAVVSWAPGTVAHFDMVITASDPAGNQAATRAIRLQAVKTPTDLLVQPAVARLDDRTISAGSGGVVNNGIYVLFATARLQVGGAEQESEPASIGNAVAGRKVSFFAGSTHLCDAISRPDGVAFCQGNLAARHLATVLNNGYQAKFSGDHAYLPATGLGPVAAVS